MPRRALIGGGIVAAALAWPAGAAGEIVYLTSGRTLSVQAYRVEGDRAVLDLRAGGQVSFPASLVARVLPDEVPYPDPAAEAGTAEPPLRAGVLAPPREIAALVEQASLRHAVDPTLVHAVIAVESSYRPRARSHKGAMGLMQLMPETARRYDLANPYDPAANIDAGVRHLRSLLDRFDLTLALAAYNAGEGAVARFGGVPPYPETRAYIQRVLAFLTP